MRSGVGDRRSRLGREHRQDLFVLARELQLSLLPGQIEIADMRAAVPNRRSHESPHRHEVVRKAERPDVGGQVPEPERFREPAEVFEELRPLGQVHQPLVLFRSQAGGDEVLELSRLIKGRDPAVAGTGQRAGALHNFMQNGIDIEALADAQTGLAQPGEALSQRLDLYSQLDAWLQFPTLAGLDEQQELVEQRGPLVMAQGRNGRGRPRHGSASQRQ